MIASSIDGKALKLLEGSTTDVTKSDTSPLSKQRKRASDLKCLEFLNVVLFYCPLQCRKHQKTRPASLSIVKMAKICTSYQAIRAVLSETANQPAKNQVEIHLKSDLFSLPSNSENQSSPTRNSSSHLSVSQELLYEMNSKSQDKTT